MGSAFKIEEPQKSASMVCIIYCHDLFTGSWCWPEEVTVALLDVILTGAGRMPSCAGFGDATKPVLFPPDEDPENQRHCLLFSAGETAVCWFGTFIFRHSVQTGTCVLACCPVLRGTQFWRFCSSWWHLGSFAGSSPAAPLHPCTGSCGGMQPPESWCSFPALAPMHVVHSFLKYFPCLFGFRLFFILGA